MNPLTGSGGGGNHSFLNHSFSPEKRKAAVEEERENRDQVADWWQLLEEVEGQCHRIDQHCRERRGTLRRLRVLKANDDLRGRQRGGGEGVMKIKGGWGQGEDWKEWEA